MKSKFYDDRKEIIFMKKEIKENLLLIAGFVIGIGGVGYLIGHFTRYTDCLDQIKENKDIIIHGIGKVALCRFLEKIEREAPEAYEKLHACMHENLENGIRTDDIDVDWINGTVTAEIYGVKTTMF